MEDENNQRNISPEPMSLVPVMDPDEALKDIGHMLEVIYSHSPALSSRLYQLSQSQPEAGTPPRTEGADTSDDDTVLFAGRYVIVIDRPSPLQVSKRFVRPQVKNNDDDRHDPEKAIRKFFDMRDLSNVLLLITNSPNSSKEYIMHGFAIEKQQHLGVTILTKYEKDTIVGEQKPSTYSIIFCTAHIELDDVYLTTPIKDQVFDVLLRKPVEPVRAWYGDRNISLQYRCCESTVLNIPSTTLVNPQPEEHTSETAPLPIIETSKLAKILESCILDNCERNNSVEKPEVKEDIAEPERHRSHRDECKKSTVKPHTSKPVPRDNTAKSRYLARGYQANTPRVSVQDVRRRISNFELKCQRPNRSQHQDNERNKERLRREQQAAQRAARRNCQNATPLDQRKEELRQLERKWKKF